MTEKEELVAKATAVTGVYILYRVWKARKRNINKHREISKLYVASQSNMQRLMEEDASDLQVAEALIYDLNFINIIRQNL